MSPAPYPDFRWLVRPLRALPIIAIAALAGGIIGGFSVFAIDLALTAPPDRGAGAEVGKINTQKAVNTAATTPAAGTSAPPALATTEGNAPAAIAESRTDMQNEGQGTRSAQISLSGTQIAVTPPLSPQQTTWPDALSRERKPEPNSAAPTATVSTAAAPVEPEPAAPQLATASSGKISAPEPARAADSTPERPANAEVARTPVPVKPRLTAKRTAGTEASTQGHRAVYGSGGYGSGMYGSQGPSGPAAPLDTRRQVSTQSGRRVYDSYGRSEAEPPDTRARYRYTDQRGSEHADDDDRSGDDSVVETDRDGAMPPQPAPPPPLFFGLFGGFDNR